MVFGVGFDPDKGEHMVQRDPRSSNRFYVSRSAGAEVFAVLARSRPGPSYVVEERTTASYVTDLLPDVEVDWGEASRSARPRTTGAARAISCSAISARRRRRPYRLPGRRD
jgi:hypothetical protein